MLFKCATRKTKNLSELLNVIQQVNGEGGNGKRFQLPCVNACLLFSASAEDTYMGVRLLWGQLSVGVKTPGFTVTKT